MRPTNFNAIVNSWSQAKKGFCYVLWCNTTDKPFFSIPILEDYEEEALPTLTVYVFNSMNEARDYREILTSLPQCNVNVEIKCLGLSELFTALAKTLRYIESDLESKYKLKAEFAYLRDGRVVRPVDSLWNCVDQRH